MQVNPDTFGRFMWLISFTICDIFWCYWIRFVKIFSTIPVVSLLKFQCDSGVSLFFNLFLSPLSLQIIMKKYKRKTKQRRSSKSTSKLRYRYHWKDFDKINSITPKKVTNSKRSGSHEPFKYDRAHFFMGCSCDPLQSSLMIFFNLVRFVSLRYF
jgi:hypothetical protein